MSWERWLSRYREGRVFVTNGPLLTFAVNDKPMGSEISVPAGQTYKASLRASVQARESLQAIEFIQNGRVLEKRELDGATSANVDKEVLVDSSSWFAGRVMGVRSRAHSGPVYIRVGSEPSRESEPINR